MENDPETIRQKRLAKLAQSSSSANAAPAASPKPPSPPVPLAKKPVLEEPTIQAPKPSRKLFDAMKMQVDEVPSPKASPVKLNPKILTESEWEHTLCSKALNVSLEPVNTKVYLEQVANELRMENEKLEMNKNQWERIIYSRLLMNESEPLLDYLKRAWLKVQTWKTKESALRAGKIDEFASLLMNYIGLIMNPETADMFPANGEDGSGMWGRRLIASSDVVADYPKEFVEALIARFKEEGLVDIIAVTVKQLDDELSTKTIGDDYLPCFKAFQYLISFKDIAHIIINLEAWFPANIAGHEIEKQTILGPFFGRTSIFPDNESQMVQKFFPSNGGYSDSLHDTERGVGNRNHGDVETAKKGLRESVLIAQNFLYDILMALIKTGPEAKAKVLQYISDTINLNTKRGQMQPDRTQLCTDGFIHNLMQAGKRLCEPIIDPSFSKIHLIDTAYFLKYDRVDVNDTTRVNVDNDVAAEITKKYREGPITEPNFVSDIFLLTTALHHYGLMSTIRLYKTFVKELTEMQTTSSRYQSMRDRGDWEQMDPVTRSANEQGLTRLQTRLDLLLGIKLVMEAGLFDNVMLEQTIQFYGMLMMWIVKVASGVKSSVSWTSVSLGNTTGLGLFPLSNETEEFKTMPEWIIEDICDFYLFIMRYKAPIFENHPRNEFMTFAAVLLYNGDLMKNPYLKSKLVEILYSFTLPLWRTQSGETIGRLDGPLFSHPLMKDHLIDTILRFYIDAERTGASSQFYDKFNIRYNISQILKAVWTDPHHVSKAVALTQKTEFFVKFVNLLMNDTTYLLDEALSKLKEIGTIQVELSVPLDSNATNEQRRLRQEREGTLISNERQALSYMSLANATVDMFGYLTANPQIVGPFMANEIVDRLAAMLDHNLVELVGPRCSELKVANPEKYHFDPKKLLGDLTTVFVNLSHRDEFVLAVARDGRSYNNALFLKAAGIVSKHNLKSPDAIQAFLNFVSKVEAKIQEDIQEEEELGEIPDDFLDPLLFTLMKEPVKLPSGVTVDLSTIRSHLLSDQHDPFNRQPLTIDQVVPDDEIKERIAQWKRERKAS